MPPNQLFNETESIFDFCDAIIAGLIFTDSLCAIPVFDDAIDIASTGINRLFSPIAHEKLIINNIILMCFIEPKINSEHMPNTFTSTARIECII